jgi:hypothetical protein
MNIRSNVRSMACPIAATVCLSLVPVVSIGLASDGAIAAKPSPWAAKKIDPKAPTAWSTYTAKQGKFSVLMPGETRVASQPMTLPTGDRSTVWVVIGMDQNSPKTGYVAGYADLPMSFDPKSNAAKEGVNAEMESFAKARNLQVLSQTRFALKGFPGQEIRYRTREGGTGQYRVFLVNRRVYILMAGSTQSSMSQQKVDRFMQSFKLM